MASITQYVPRSGGWTHYGDTYEYHEILSPKGAVDWQPMNTINNIPPLLGYGMGKDEMVERNLAYLPGLALLLGFKEIGTCVSMIHKRVILNQNSITTVNDVQIGQITERTYSATPVKLCVGQRIAILVIALALFIRAIITLTQCGLMLLWPLDYLYDRFTGDNCTGFTYHFTKDL